MSTYSSVAKNSIVIFITKFSACKQHSVNIKRYIRLSLNCVGTYVFRVKSLYDVSSRKARE